MHSEAIRDFLNGWPCFWHLYKGLLIRQPSDDFFGQRFAFVFLNKVAAVFDDFMGLIFCSGHPFLLFSDSGLSGVTGTNVGKIRAHSL